MAIILCLNAKIIRHSKICYFFFFWLNINIFNFYFCNCISIQSFVSSVLTWSRFYSSIRPYFKKRYWKPLIDQVQDVLLRWNIDNSYNTILNVVLGDEWSRYIEWITICVISIQVDVWKKMSRYKLQITSCVCSS